MKHLEFEMVQLYLIVNPRKPRTFSSNIFQNHKNNGHCMEITNRCVKKTIDPPMPSSVENVIKSDDVVVGVSVIWEIKQ